MLIVAAALALAPRADADVGVTISGQAIVGQTLTAEVTGDPLPGPPFQWLRCEALAPNVCEPIPGAAESTYVVVAADAGHRLAVRATAGESFAVSALTDAVLWAPGITSLTITGDAAIGNQLTANATATGFPTPDLTYQWERCAAAQPTNCQPIAGQTGTTYLVTTADAGSRLRVTATATNTAGSDEQASAPTDVVLWAPSIVAVQVTGTATVGEQLTANATATGSPTPDLTYQWERCAAAQPTNCAADRRNDRSDLPGDQRRRRQLACGSPRPPPTRPAATNRLRRRPAWCSGRRASSPSRSPAPRPSARSS